MKAHELLDCDDQETADNAADLLRTFARILDDLRYLAAIVPGGTGSWMGMTDAESVLRAHWSIQSDNAPVEDWLDHQWAVSPDQPCNPIPIDDWPPEAKARLLRDIMRDAQHTEAADD